MKDKSSLRYFWVTLLNIIITVAEFIGGAVSGCIADKVYVICGFDFTVAFDHCICLFVFQSQKQKGKEAFRTKKKETFIYKKNDRLYRDLAYHGFLPDRLLYADQSGRYTSQYCRQCGSDRYGVGVCIGG